MNFIKLTKTTLIAQTGWYVRTENFGDVSEKQATVSQEIVAEIPSYSSDTDNDLEKKKP